MRNFLETAESRETSPEIMEAILFVAGGDETRAVRVWEAPIEPEMIAIWERVTNNGLTDANEYTWGASGYGWANSIEAE